ncbi:MAG: lysophospholipid acyltransferase family protein [Bacilli bacterium]
MVLFLLLVALSLALSGLTYYFAGWSSDLWTLFIPLPLTVLYWFALFALFVAYCWFVSLFVDLKKPVTEPKAGGYFVVKNVIWIVLLFANVKVKIVGAEKIPARTRYLFVSNHLSNFDHLCYFAHRKERVISLGKKEIERLFVAGKWMHKAGFIAIDRNDPVQGLRCILQCVDYIKKDEASIALAPEGTRSHDGLLHEFHAGSFKIALKSQCPLVVARIHNSENIRGNAPWKRTLVRIDILDVLYPKDYQDLPSAALANKAHALIEASLDAEPEIPLGKK